MTLIPAVSSSLYWLSFFVKPDTQDIPRWFDEPVSASQQ